MSRNRCIVSAVVSAALFTALCPAAPAAPAAPASGPQQPGIQGFVTRAEFERAFADLRREVAAGNFATKAEVAELRARLETLRARLNQLKTQVGQTNTRLGSFRTPPAPNSAR